MGMRFLAAVTLLVVSAESAAQQWTSYGGDPGGQKYSALDQIHRGNVKRLRVAWTYHTGDVSDGKSGTPVPSAFESTPLAVDGVLYFTTVFNRLIALDGETGRELWSFDRPIALLRAVRPPRSGVLD